jgi:DNA-binding transcriptional regulator YhcF (GntR family)
VHNKRDRQNDPVTRETTLIEHQTMDDMIFIIKHIIEHIGRYVTNLVAPSNNKKEHLMTVSITQKWQLIEAMWDTTNLKPQTKEVFYQIVRTYNHKEDRCYFHSEEQLAKRLQVSRHTVLRAIVKLEENGWLNVERRGVKNCNEYYPNWGHKADSDDEGVVATVRQLKERVVANGLQHEKSVVANEAGSCSNRATGVVANEAVSCSKSSRSVVARGLHRHIDNNTLNKPIDIKHIDITSDFVSDFCEVAPLASNEGLLSDEPMREPSTDGRIDNSLSNGKSSTNEQPTNGSFSPVFPSNEPTGDTATAFQQFCDVFPFIEEELIEAKERFNKAIELGNDPAKIISFVVSNRDAIELQRYSAAMFLSTGDWLH